MKVKKETSIVDYEAMGSRIAQKRKEQHISQEKLAEMANISPTNLSHIERGKTKGSIETVVAIANALNVTPDAFLCDSLSGTSSQVKDAIASNLNDLSSDELRLVVELADVVKKTQRKPNTPA